MNENLENEIDAEDEFEEVANDTVNKPRLLINLEVQRQVVRDLMVLEDKIARLREQLTKPIDYDHRDNQITNRVPKELAVVKHIVGDTLLRVEGFINDARNVTHWRAFNTYKLGQWRTDQAVKKADQQFDEAFAKYKTAMADLVAAASTPESGDPADTKNSTENQPISEEQ